MIILRNVPKDQILEYIDFVSAEELIKINDSLTLSYIFESSNQTRDSVSARNEYNRKKNNVINRLKEKAQSLEANAIIDFVFDVKKFDNKYILLQGQGFAVTLSETEKFKVRDASSEYLDPQVAQLMKDETMPKLLGGKLLDIGNEHQFTMMHNLSKSTDIPTPEVVPAETPYAPTTEPEIDLIVPLEHREQTHEKENLAQNNGFPIDNFLKTKP